MPVSPEVAARAAREVRAIYESAANDLLQRVAQRVSQGLDSPEDVARLSTLNQLVRDADRVISDLDRQAPGAVQRAVEFAYSEGSTSATREAKALGVTSSFAGPPDTRAIRRLVGEALGPHQSVTTWIRRSVLDAYDEVTRFAAGQALVGGQTRLQASRQALQRLADRGVTGFRDRSGRNWDVASYAEMSVRTVAGRAAVAGQMDTLLSLGVDTVYVSDSPEECELCRPFEHQVLSITGNTTGTLSDGRKVLCSVQEATRRGLFHPNCTHSQSIYLPGFTELSPQSETADPKEYEERQKQRAFERRVRKWKRRVEVETGLTGRDSPETKAVRKKLRSVQSEFKGWRDATGRRADTSRTNLNYR